MTAAAPVVVGIDEYPDNEPAVRWALADARTRHAPVELICAYRWLWSLPPLPLYADVADTEQEIRLAAAQRLLAREAGFATAVDPSVQVRTVERDKNPVPCLIECSREAAVLVLGSRQLASVASQLLGSVSGAVAARAHCPVVVMRGTSRPATPVLAGIDGSESSQPVLEFAFDHASRHGLGLDVLLAWPPAYLDTFDVLETTIHPHAQAWLAEAVAGWRQKYPDVATTLTVVHDSPVPALLDRIADHGLVVVGTVGHRATVASLLGSVSQGVLHHSRCPVAVVPTPTHH